MIKKLFLITTILSISFSKSFSQMDIDVKLDIDQLYHLDPSLGVEVGAGKLSADVFGTYIFSKWGETTITDANGNESKTGIKRSGFVAGGRLNYYFNPDYSLDGWYASPYFRFCKQNIKFDTEADNKRMSTGLIIGKKAFLDERWGYQVEAGFGVNFLNEYKETKTGRVTTLEEIDPFLGSFVKIFSKWDIPISLKVIYRFGEGFQK